MREEYMNKGQIIRTLKGLYLKITGEPLDKPAYFEITLYATEENIRKEIKLSKVFDINLKAQEE
jgi:hypothetical protein